MLLRLTYNRKSDPFVMFSVLSTPDAIRDLYWQLTHNYKGQDGTEIDTVKVTNLDGFVITNIMSEPYMHASCMSVGD